MITDIRMSPVDGMSLLRTARDERPSMPVMIISAYTSDATIKESMELGCKAYIKKPFKVNDVLDQIAKLLPEEKSS